MAIASFTVVSNIITEAIAQADSKVSEGVSSISSGIASIGVGIASFAYGNYAAGISAIGSAAVTGIRGINNFAQATLQFKERGESLTTGVKRYKAAIAGLSNEVMAAGIGNAAT